MWRGHGGLEEVHPLSTHLAENAAPRVPPAIVTGKRSSSW